MIFNARDHAKLATLFDGVECACAKGAAHGCEPYPGYKPDVREAPNSDTKPCPACAGGLVPNDWSTDSIACRECAGSGRVPNVDAGPAGKRYLHVALKYDPPTWAIEYLARAHFEACRVAEALGVPDAYYPRVENGTLRVLEYPSAGHYYGKDLRICDHCGYKWHAFQHGAELVCPALAPGAGSVEHKDFDLFTILCWRSTPEDLELTDGTNPIGEAFDADTSDARLVACRINPGLHIGRLGELVGLGPATPHRVPARPYTQRSIIYFAMPAMAARLPCPAPIHHGDPGECRGGQTVREWLDEVYAASRIGVASALAEPGYK